MKLKNNSKSIKSRLLYLSTNILDPGEKNNTDNLILGYHLLIKVLQALYIL